MLTSTPAKSVVVRGGGIVEMLPAGLGDSSSLRLVLYWSEVGRFLQCHSNGNIMPSYHTMCKNGTDGCLPAENKPAPDFLETCFYR